MSLESQDKRRRSYKVMLITNLFEILNTTGNVRTNLTVRRVRATIVTAENQ